MIVRSGGVDFECFKSFSGSIVDVGNVGVDLDLFRAFTGSIVVAGSVVEDTVCFKAFMGAVVAVAVGASRASGLSGGCSEFCAVSDGFFWVGKVAERELIPGGKISIGCCFPASANVVSLGSSREARNAAVASVLCDFIGSTSLCSIWFQA